MSNHNNISLHFYSALAAFLSLLFLFSSMLTGPVHQEEAPITVYRISSDSPSTRLVQTRSTQSSRSPATPSETPKTAAVQAPKSAISTGVSQAPEAKASLSLQNAVSGQSNTPSIGESSPTEAPPVFNVGEGSSSQGIPKLLRGKAPEYPEKAWEEGIHGYVKVKLLVNKSGQVEKVEILEGQDRWGFADAVKKTVTTWLFEPYRHKGIPSSFYLIKPFEFRVVES